MNSSIVFICPYFGKINMEQYELWMKCCEKNSNIDFRFLIDDERAFSCDRPANVKLERMSWEECKARILERLGFNVSLVYAYKLCDLKPAYGYIFPEYVEGYDFWGHIDFSDTILGDLSRFITDDILDKYDKVHIYGHLTLYRNNPENNERFKIPAKCGVTIQELFSREEVTGFDEMYNMPSINVIFRENNFPLLNGIKDLVADVHPRYWYFRLSQDGAEKVNRVFEWDNGKLYELTADADGVSKREIGYAHFQKRSMSNQTSRNTSHFYAIPNQFIDADHEFSAAEIIELSKDRFYFKPYKDRLKRIKWYLRHPKAFIRRMRRLLLRR